MFPHIQLSLWDEEEIRNKGRLGSRAGLGGPEPEANFLACFSCVV